MNNLVFFTDKSFELDWILQLRLKINELDPRYNNVKLGKEVVRKEN